jgi:hypothetical protein
MAGVADKFRIIRVRDRTNPYRKVVDVGSVDGPLIRFTVVGAHQELTGSDSRHARQRLVSHLL